MVAIQMPSRTQCIKYTCIAAMSSPLSHDSEGTGIAKLGCEGHSIVVCCVPPSANGTEDEFEDVDGGGEWDSSVREDDGSEGVAPLPVSHCSASKSIVFFPISLYF